MNDIQQFAKVDFTRFKAFRSFRLHLRPFNILVGPNNAGKSTVLTAFRILAAGLRRATSRKPELLRGPEGRNLGYPVDLSSISVGEENIFYNYDDSEPAIVRFTLSNRNTLTLYFPEHGACSLFAEDPRRLIRSPAAFRSYFNCPVGFVPILGPVEHNERVYQEEAARRALFNYRAARNFRNIWYHFPEKFAEFRALLQQTWPGMDVEPPTVDISYDKPVLHMFCPEVRIPREIFWSGFGFQVWCQMLTHLVQSRDASIFLIDEPDIYLHSDLQRQLLGLLRNLGPDILIATHSTEIITEAEADDIVIVDKSRRSARRVRDPGELAEVFSLLGSNLNPVLTQLAKTRRVLFVEGLDFQVLAKFARKTGMSSVGNRSSFAVVPIGGCDPERVRSLKRGMEATLGGVVAAAVMLDRDYRSDEECCSLRRECEEICDVVLIHDCKEVENYLLVPAAIDRAARRRLGDQERRTGKKRAYQGDAAGLLLSFAGEQKSYVTSQRLARRRHYWRQIDPGKAEASLNQEGIEEFEELWKDESKRWPLLPGKEALAFINRKLQEEYGVSITPTAVIEAMEAGEVPEGVRAVLREIHTFGEVRVGAVRRT